MMSIGGGFNPGLPKRGKVEEGKKMGQSNKIDGQAR